MAVGLGLWSGAAGRAHLLDCGLEALVDKLLGHGHRLLADGLAAGADDALRHILGHRHHLAGHLLHRRLHALAACPRCGINNIKQHACVAQIPHTMSVPDHCISLLTAFVAQ